MKKIIMVIVVLLMLVMVILNTSKNTSTTELLVSETKARNDIESIHGAIDVVGMGAFKGVEIKSTGFKGEVTQPASSTTNHLTKYIIKSDGATSLLSVDYSKDEIEVTGGTAPFDDVEYADLAIPAQTRKNSLGTVKIPMDALSDQVNAGIPPIIKDTNSKEWVKTFLLSDTGMALERLASSDGNSSYDALITAIEGDKGVDFMEIIFGNPDIDKLKWNEYKSDRIVAMKQVNVDALTGLADSEAIQKLTNPNLVTLYQVDHINTVTLDKIHDAVKTDFEIANMADFSKLVTHINQMLGGKLVLIPNQDASILIIDGVPTFVLN